MRVQIMSNHPISNPKGPESWDGKVHEYDGDLRDVQAVGAWLTSKVGVKFNYRPGHSRFDAETQRCLFFPARATTGLHCMWIVPAAPENA